MIRKNVYEHFKLYFPEKNVEAWSPNGPSSIRVKTGDRQEFIFTCITSDDWCLETPQSHINRLKGVKR